MNCPKSNHLVIEGHESASPATSWGKKEVAREIALLEAHIYQDKIARLTQEALESSEGDLKGGTASIAVRGISKELLQAYDNYARVVISSRTTSFTEAIGAILDSLRAVAGHLSGSKYYLSSAETIRLLKTELCKLMSLDKIAETACNRTPLFAYGPELSEFRHRLR